MKKIVLIFLFSAASGVAFSQDNAIDKYFRDFEQKNSLDLVSVSSKMFTVFLQSKEGKKKEELSVIIKKLKGLKTLSMDNPKNGLDLYNSAILLVPGEYQTIMTLKETDRNAKFFTKEDKAGQITEMIMIAWQWGRFIILSITGNIDLNEILKLSQNLEIQGFNGLKKLKTSN